MKQDFLLEIGCEELPAAHLNFLAVELRERCLAQLVEAQLLDPKELESQAVFATPRRLAVLIKNVQEQQSDQLVQRSGPALAAAFDAAGQPTPAAVGFAKSCHTTVDKLEKKEGKLFFSQLQPGKSAVEVLKAMVSTVLAQLPLSKPMRWGDSTIEFLRPVQWVVMLYGATLIETTLLGKSTQRMTYGHRFHSPEPILLQNANEYITALDSKKNVMPEFNARQASIQTQINALAASIEGKIHPDADLLKEVTSLVEWPVALLAKFDAKFLAVPAEALTSAMKQHQKCFPVYDQNNTLMPYFIFVSNITSRDPSEVIRGNERVMRARLNDAAFFYQTDLKIKLQNRLSDLQKIVFQAELGTLHDKALRIGKLAVNVAEALQVNYSEVELAGQLAKADLTSSMVGEFPELQGIMGYYYALHDGHNSNVALAIKEHYSPRFLGDALPSTEFSCVVAIADKLDTLVGIFGINKLPTGDKDPFALRRAALGILRILIEKKFSIDLAALINSAKMNYAIALPNQQLESQLLTFFFERLRSWYTERSVSADVINAVLALKPTCPHDVDQRIAALATFKKHPAAAALASAHKRVNNSLAKQASSSFSIDATLLQLPAEKELVQGLEKKQHDVQRLYAQKDYANVLIALADLREPIDQFFNTVMVMVDDATLRANRLAILNTLNQLFGLVADLSLLQYE